MGEIVANIELENPGGRALFERGDDQESDIRRASVEALADTGTVMPVLPRYVVDRVGADIRRTAIVTYAMVVLTSACPNRNWMVRMSVPRILQSPRPRGLAPIKMRQFIFTHTSGPVPRHAVLGVGGCPITRGRGSARGLVQCRRGRITEQREPVVDPLSGQTLMGAGPLVPSPAPCAQIEPSTEQVEKALGSALVHVEIGA